MTISVIIATYGDDSWRRLAWNRAFPSADAGNPDGEVLVLHYPTGTRASSLNNLAHQATGDWLCFLDADDELAPGYLAAMRRAIERDLVDRGGICRTFDEPAPLFTPAAQWVRRGRPGLPSFQKEVPLERGNWLVIGTLIRRDLFMEIGGFHEHPHGLEDYNLWARAVRAGAKIVKVPDAVYIAHWNPQSKHRQLFRNKKEFWPAYEAARVDAWG